MQTKSTNDVGKQIRYDRIVNPNTGKTVIIPMDHGIILGPIKGIENPTETVNRIVGGGADAVLFNSGMARWIHPECAHRCGSIFNLTNLISAGDDLTLISTVEYAVKHAADAVSVQVIIGSSYEREMLNNFRIVAENCARWSMPLLAMMYPTDELLAKRGEEIHIHAARAGAEMGADLVKTSYTGDPDSFTKLVEACPAPVVIAGGPKKNTSLEILQMVKEAMDCGAAGVALGRNVWQSGHPNRMTKALVEIVHHGQNVDDLDWPKG